IRAMIERTRSLTFEISPRVLYDLGLKAALSGLCESTQRKFGLTCTLHAEGPEQKLEHNTRVLLYQAARELLHNVMKHASAKAVHVTLKITEGSAGLVVADDGTGILPNRSIASGFGLFSLRERLNHLGGNLSISSLPGKGTEITVHVPSL
ncbi:MAG TPA: ATP-binding protein, partial [Planctomycetota bacterium]